MTYLDSILKSRDITLLKKVCQGYAFSSSHVWMCELDHKESWAPRNWCFCTVVLEKALESPWTARRSNQSILKEISPEYSKEGLILKLKLQNFGHLMRRIDSLKNKYPDAGKDWRQEEKGMTEDETVGWHHWLNGHESDEQALGASDGTGKPDMLQSMGSQRVAHDWATELNW